MNTNRTLIVVGAIATAFVVFALFCLHPTRSGDDGRSGSDALLSAKARSRDAQQPRVRLTAKKRRVSGVPVREKKDKPGFDIGAAERDLNEEQRKLLEEIRSALREDDYRRLMALVHKLQTSDEWPDGIPKAIKMAALKALSWYGGKTLPEVVGFLADLDKDVVRAAADSWDDALAELDHDVDWLDEAGNVKDPGIATNIKSASLIVNDPEVMESIFSEIQASLRHSVAVETIKYILENGNATAQSKIAAAIEDLTGSDEIKTVEQLDDWLKKNPDDADDDYMYGGKDSGDDVEMD